MDLYNFLPNITVFLGMTLVATIAMFLPKKQNMIVFAFSLCAHIVFLKMLFDDVDFYLTDMFHVFGMKIKLMMVGSILSIVTIFLHGYRNYESGRNITFLNYLFVALVFLIGSNEFVVFFMSLELISIIFFLHLVMSKSFFSEKEAAKYFLHNFLISIILLISILLFYMATGTLSFGSISVMNNDLFALATGMILMVFCFKSGVFPFHFWVSSIYTKMSRGLIANTVMIVTPIILYIFLALIQSLISLCVLSTQQVFNILIPVVAVVTAAYGSVRSIARVEMSKALHDLLIASSGYLLIGVCLSPNTDYLNHLLFYLVAMSISFTGALLVLKNGGQDGLVKDKDWARGIFLIIFILSVIGTPFFVGFPARYMMFTIYFKEGYIISTAILLLSSLLGLHIAIRVFQMVFGSNMMEGFSVGKLGIRNNYIYILLVILVLLLGMFPSVLLKYVASI